jgi:hypothetical protein
MVFHNPSIATFKNYVNLKLRWRWLIAELILETLMLMAPANLDILGAAGEYLVDVGRVKTELAA